MQETFDKLKVLQEILFKKYELEKEINEIPKALVTKVEVLNRGKKSFIERVENLEALKLRVKKLHFDLLDAGTTRENYEKQMDQIKTSKEYEALEKEIREASEKEQNLRKEIQREEKELEELSHQVEKQERQLAMDEEELKEEEQRIKSESQSKKDELVSLESEEKSITPGLGHNLIFKFERIIKSKQGVGIVAIKNGTCSGCHMILPMQYVNEVRREEEIKFCPYCSRILYFESEMDPTRIFADTGMGTLADLIVEE